MTTWEKAVMGELSGEDVLAMLPEGAELLQGFLRDEEQGPGVVQQILEKHLRGEVSDSAPLDMLSSLVKYAGSERGHLIAWFLDLDDESPMLEQFLEQAGAEAAGFVKALRALYCDDLSTAAQSRDDWHSLTHDVFLDALVGAFVVRIRLRKGDGQITTIEGSPTSLLNLVNKLLRILGQVGTAEAFDLDIVEDFRDQAEGFFEALTDEESSVSE